MSKNQEKIKVVDENCKAAPLKQEECGYWIHINHFFNCYSDCKVYLDSFKHCLQRKVITEQGLILIPLSHKISNISNVVCCVICDDKNCYMCKNFKNVADGCKSVCSCNKYLRDDHAVARVNWFISNFKMCATMKERLKPKTTPQLSKEKNDNINKTKDGNGLKNTDKKGIKINITKTGDCTDSSKVEPCANEKANVASHLSGVVKKYSKVKTKKLNDTVKLKENTSLKLPELNADSKSNIREHTEKPLVDDEKLSACASSSGTIKKTDSSKLKVIDQDKLSNNEKLQAHVSSTGTIKKNVGAVYRVNETPASDLQILTRDSFTRFAEKYDSLSAFGPQCLFCKILGHFYDGRYCDLIIPDFCLRDWRQTTCEKPDNEKDRYGKQYCLTVENAYVDPGVGPKLIGKFTDKQIPLIDLDKGMNFYSNKSAETGFGKAKSRKNKTTKVRMVSCAEEMKRRDKKEENTE